VEDLSLSSSLSLSLSPSLSLSLSLSLSEEKRTFTSCYHIEHDLKYKPLRRPYIFLIAYDMHPLPLVFVEKNIYIMLP
jgi:hypothetical protein